MKLSRLVYECVKNGINYPTNNFTYETFMNDEYNDKQDYEYQFANVFSALNLALSRLQDSNKIPFKVEMDVPVTNNMVDFSEGKVYNIVVFSKGNYERIEFRTLEQNKKYYLITDRKLDKVAVEYLPTIPRINGRADMKEKDTDIEESYGINDVMTSYIIEFVKGQLYEIVSPEIANLHNNRAEQYFQDIKRANTNFYQSKIKNSLKGFF